MVWETKISGRSKVSYFLKISDFLSIFLNDYRADDEFEHLISNFNVYKNHIVSGLNADSDSVVWGESLGLAFLITSQVMLMLLVHRPHCKWLGHNLLWTFMGKSPI